MLKLLIATLALCAVMSPQEKPASPQVRVNLLNVCTPGDAEKQDLAAALERIAVAPKFGPDFEIARGRATQSKGNASDFVRLRREFASGGVFSNVQFLLSVEGKRVSETLVFHARENKPGEPMQISFDEEVSAGTPQQVLASDTPPTRMRLERFGKPSLVLARCANVDQAAYDTLFRTAADIFARYRKLLNIRTTMVRELERMQLPVAPATASNRPR